MGRSAGARRFQGIPADLAIVRLMLMRFIIHSRYLSGLICLCLPLVVLQVLLKNLRVPRECFMACGDGSNDYEMVANAGIGIAMGNAVDSVKQAAAFVTSSHDDDGIAEAFEKYVL